MSTLGPTVTAPPQATPNGTISIGCFLAVQSVVDEFRHLAFQLDELPISDQKPVLDTFASQLQVIVVGAPTGCFSDRALTALEAVWAYVAETPRQRLAKQRIVDLISAVGLPYPTPAP